MRDSISLSLYHPEEELWDRIQNLHKTHTGKGISLDEFYEIINQVDFDIESYEISKKIAWENEKQLDKHLLKMRWDEWNQVNKEVFIEEFGGQIRNTFNIDLEEFLNNNQNNSDTNEEVLND